VVSWWLCGFTTDTVGRVYSYHINVRFLDVPQVYGAQDIAMFEHLPRITEENLDVVTDKEIDYFAELLRHCSKQSETPDEAIDCMCNELNRLNPHLVKAVRGAAYSVAAQLEGEIDTGLEWKAGVATVPGVLATLRLIDRALEAKQLEAEIASLEGG